ncbi:MAG: hypothetical protein KJN93_04815, partial [Alphaproteobacteria bacterium]|nr:hypothetical protein [Alphaproteobacteria bacterium]
RMARQHVGDACRKRSGRFGKDRRSAGYKLHACDARILGLGRIQVPARNVDRCQAQHGHLGRRRKDKQRGKA